MADAEQSYGRTGVVIRAVLDAAGREQRRVGRELHDNLGQQLTAIAFLASSLEQSLGDAAEEAAAKLREIQEIVKTATVDTRSLARGLAPVGVDGHSLVPALQELAADCTRLYGMRCEFRSDGTATIEDDFVATHLFHIATEAVRNAAVHSEGTLVELVFAHEVGGLALIVSDNGGGLRDEAASQSGLGIRVMAFRAAMIGATLDIAPGREAGTRVTCRLA